jgi:hypothetical protein
MTRDVRTDDRTSHLFSKEIADPFRKPHPEDYLRVRIPVLAEADGSNLSHVLLYHEQGTITARFYLAGISIGALTGARTGTFKTGPSDLGFTRVSSGGDASGRRVWYTCSKISPRQDT